MLSMGTRFWVVKGVRAKERSPGKEKGPGPRAGAWFPPVIGAAPPVVAGTPDPIWLVKQERARADAQALLKVWRANS